MTTNTNGLVGWGTSIGLTNQPVLGSNPTRTGLVFVNSGTVSIAICPATVNIGINGVYPPGVAPPGVAVINGPGSVTMAPGDKFIFDNLNVPCGWNGIAAAAGGAITIFEIL